MLCLASASRFGVACFAPKKPMRSARVESSVMRMMFGLFAAEESARRKTEIRMPKTNENNVRRSIEMSLTPDDIIPKEARLVYTAHWLQLQDSGC